MIWKILSFPIFLILFSLFALYIFLYFIKEKIGEGISWWITQLEKLKPKDSRPEQK